MIIANVEKRNEQKNSAEERKGKMKIANENMSDRSATFYRFPPQGWLLLFSACKRIAVLAAFLALKSPGNTTVSAVQTLTRGEGYPSEKGLGPLLLNFAKLLRVHLCFALINTGSQSEVYAPQRYLRGRTKAARENESAPRRREREKRGSRASRDASVNIKNYAGEGVYDT